MRLYVCVCLCLCECFFSSNNKRYLNITVFKLLSFFSIISYYLQASLLQPRGTLLYLFLGFNQFCFIFFPHLLLFFSHSIVRRHEAQIYRIGEYRYYDVSFYFLFSCLFPFLFQTGSFFFHITRGYVQSSRHYSSTLVRQTQTLFSIFFNIQNIPLRYDSADETWKNYTIF